MTDEEVSTKTKWSFDSAVKFARDLNVFIQPRGYHVALHGGCLHKEGWRKDCDIIVFPMRAQDRLGLDSHLDRVDDIGKHLREFGLLQRHTAQFVNDRWRLLGSDDTKHVEIWDHQGRRVDVFFLC